MLAAIVAGGLVGIEREWRGRAAGFRTHILVCLASALLMQASMQQADWHFELIAGQRIVADPARMAHGILTGIGFLCAGVIFRAGFSIHGLTTAASLWMTSAIGILLGASLYWQALVGTAVTVAILVVLRLVSHSVRGHVIVDVEACWPRDAADVEADVEAVLAGKTGGRVKGDRFELADEGRTIRRRWRLHLYGEADIKNLANELVSVRGLTGLSLDPRDD